MAIKRDVSQKVIRAGQKHLQEILEGEATILIGVKESNQAESLGLLDAEVALVSQEVKHFEGADERVAVSVKSLEG